MRTVALIPAHNEERDIGRAIEALRGQTVPPDQIVVVADNCTDSTADIARSLGARVFVTRGNKHKKAGALNQALGWYLYSFDRVLVQDADTILDHDFMWHGHRHLDGGFDAVGGVFRGGPGGGLVGTFQRNEYARYARDIKRRDGDTLVLTGTATLFTAETLRAVAASRDSGVVYDTRVLTEDNELTLRILHLGGRIVAPPECTMETEVMPTWRALWRQRHRWKRGAWENLRDYGLTRVTARYWGLQVVSVIGLLVMTVYLSSVAGALSTGTLHVYPLWLWVTAVFALERAVTVASRGRAMQALGAVVVVEMTFDLFLQAVHAKALADSLLNRERRW